MDREILEALVSTTDMIYAAKVRTDLMLALQSGCSALGFDLFTLSCHKPGGREMILDSTFTTVDPAFLSDYDRFDWFDDDLMAHRVISEDQPFFWNSARDRSSDIRKQSYLDFLLASDLCTGVMVPLPRYRGTFSMMGLISLADKSCTAATSHAARIMATTAMAKAEMLGLATTISADEATVLRHLSPPQREILNWMSEGKSNGDIATITHLSERMVRHHVSEILRKFGVATRIQAVNLLRAASCSSSQHRI